MKKRLGIYLALTIIFNLKLIQAREDIRGIEEEASLASPATRALLRMTVENQREFDQLERSAQHHNVTHLDLSNFVLEWRHVLRLPPLIAAFPDLSEFSVAAFPDNSEQFYRSLSAFRKASCLTHLCLTRSSLRKPLLSIFVKNIEHFPELLNLQLDDCQITSRGARLLVRAIKNNRALPKLRSLSLEKNKISFAAAKYLLRFFKTKEGFKSLSILRNPLSFEQAEGLTAFIKQQEINFTVLYPYLPGTK